MKIEIHWPDEIGGVETVDGSNNTTRGFVFNDLVLLSHHYDVIIDNGKVTFVDKE